MGNSGDEQNEASRHGILGIVVETDVLSAVVGREVYISSYRDVASSFMPRAWIIMALG